MKLRRILATSVAAAVTAPVLLLSAAPAFADGKPGSGAAEQRTKKPTIAELREAVAKARKEVDKVDADSRENTRRILAVMETLKPGGTHPLAVSRDAAQAEAVAAASAKTTADEKLAAAEKALAALPESATQEEKDAARQAVTGARAGAEAAAAAKAAADAKVTGAEDAVDDEKVRLVREHSATFVPLREAAAKALADAEKALERALAEGEDPEDPDDACEDVTETLTVRLTGPRRIAAGASGDFSLRVGNRTGAPVAHPDALLNLVDAGTGDDDLGRWLDLKASVGGAPWVDLDEDSALVRLTPMKAGASTDVKLRVTVDAKAPRAYASLLATVGYDAEDGSCGWGGEDRADFTIAQGAAKPGKPVKPAQGNGGTTAQGGSSTTPVRTTTTTTSTTPTTTTGGTLAATGAGPATLPIALAGGAAVALGAGAMVAVRRRRAGADA
ncbi:peptidase [Streptomyces sp. NPDC004787]|uniref:peptidase n=1 Tax=Streptomyces sp. NPDC004787 TaxID=3154291 RepID=UPI0033BE6955